MNLIIDIGNTSVKLATFQGKELQQHWRWPDADESKLLGLIKRKKIERVAISSTRGIDEAMLKSIQQVVPVLVLDANTPLPIFNRYKTPKTLGKDRLAAVVAAHDNYPRKNCLVIDAGTCITYDLITKNGEYLGGGISPGLEMRLKAMHSFTAKLPLVKRKKEIELIGNTTNGSLQSGGVLGGAMEVAGFIAAYRKKYSPLTVILTGGDANFLANSVETKIFVHQHLVLEGLNKIVNYNAAKKK